MCGRPIVTGAVVALLAAAPAAAADCSAAETPPASAAAVKDARVAVVCIINEERAARGLAPLTVNRKLQKSAASWATRMDKENFFAHEHHGSTARKRIVATGYTKNQSKFFVAENIGWGSGSLATPGARVRNWMAGGLHRKNLLHPKLTEIGVGIAGAPKADVNGGNVYVLNFGDVKKRK